MGRSLNAAGYVREANPAAAVRGPKHSVSGGKRVCEKWSSRGGGASVNLPRMERKSYPTDLTDAQWARLEPLVPPPKPGGRPRKAEMREVVNAVLYITRSGNAWRMMPHDLPPWGTVWFYFRTWRDDGTWEAMNDRLREACRTAVGREPEPSAAVIDSQSVKTSDRGCEAGSRGFDAGKKGQRPQAARRRGHLRAAAGGAGACRVGPRPRRRQAAA